MTAAHSGSGVQGGIDLLDTPGILWPKFDDERVGILLAVTGAVKDDILYTDTLACKLFPEILAVRAPQAIIDRYKLTIPQISRFSGVMSCYSRRAESAAF